MANCKGVYYMWFLFALLTTLAWGTADLTKEVLTAKINTVL